MSIPDKLKFNGKWYYHYKRCGRDKLWAKREVKILRDKKIPARIYAALDGSYHVYWRNK